MCVECSITHCTDCDENDEEVEICTECAASFFVEYDGLSCQSAFTQCSSTDYPVDSVTEDYYCGSCYSGYYFDFDMWRCRSCQSAITNCDMCESDEQGREANCIMCQPGYDLLGNICIANNIDHCFNSSKPNYCDACHPGYAPNADHSQCISCESIHPLCLYCDIDQFNQPVGDCLMCPYGTISSTNCDIENCYSPDWL